MTAMHPIPSSPMILKRTTRIHLAVAKRHSGYGEGHRKFLAAYYRSQRAAWTAAEFRRRYRTQYGPLLPLE